MFMSKGSGSGGREGWARPSVGREEDSMDESGKIARTAGEIRNEKQAEKGVRWERKSGSALLTP